jgi:ABC-type lipoprotein export system ATPase subunit
MADVQWAVETRELTRFYGSGASEVRALDGVNLCIAPGELVTVMGPSGSGKSTLLNMIGALDVPTSGKVYVNGRDLATVKNKDTFRGKEIGFIFQLHNLIPTLTARENVEIPMIGHLGPGKRHKRAGELLDIVGLDDRMGHLPSQLSGGQRQRVAVARALANNPSLVLADEPTGSLDTKAGHELMDLLRELNRSQGTTFLIVTHDAAIARLTNRIVVMSDGKIVREDIVGTPMQEDLKVWKHSELGQLIVEGKVPEVNGFKPSPEELRALRRLLAEG